MDIRESPAYIQEQKTLQRQENERFDGSKLISRALEAQDVMGWRGRPSSATEERWCICLRPNARVSEDLLVSSGSGVWRTDVDHKSSSFIQILVE